MSLAYASQILNRKFGFCQSKAKSNYIWTDADGYAWYQNVVSNGGVITNSNQARFDAAFQSLKSTNAQDGNSLWSHINQGYWFIGQQSFSNGLFVPFYDATGSGGRGAITSSVATNNYFTSSSYTKNAGLAGDGSTTYIDTGIANNNTSIWAPATSPYRHGYVYLKGVSNKQNLPINPFGMSSISQRTFSLQISTVNSGYSVTGKVYVDSAAGGTVFTPNSIAVDGGWGVPNINGRSVCSISIGTNSSFQVAAGTPTNSSLVSGNILIGQAAGSFSQANIIASTFGSALTSTDFASIDGIVNTLVASLT